jgi:hypothetical protein
MICLTFDTDHMSETQMRLWQEQCSFDGKGTFFCTEEFHFLADAGHEIAPHPFLPSSSDWEQKLTSWRKAFPQARCWRAHSLVFSQYLGVQLGKLGYDIVSTVDVFGRTDISPFFIPWGVWQMPIYYMDNNDFNRLDFGTLGEYEIFDPKFISQALNSDQVFVFDFHPIHYMLNTPNYAFYVANQKAFKDGESSEKLRYQGYGTRNFFDDLVRAMRLSKEISLSLPDALTLWRNKHNVQLYDKSQKDERA